MSQLLRGRAATISVTYTDTEGDVADPGVVTVTITRLDGTAVVTDAATSGSGEAARTYALSSSVTADLDTLRVMWWSETLGYEAQFYEIVGAFLFTVAEAQAFDDGLLGSEGSDISVAEIEQERERICDEFEEVCEVAFVPRYRIDTLTADWDGSLRLPVMRLSRVRSVATRSGSTWTAMDAEDVAALIWHPWGVIEAPSLAGFATGTNAVRVGYEYGYERPPAPIKRAALQTARYTLQKGRFTSQRAISISNPDGVTQQLWTPGYSGRGSAIHELPEVDKTLRQYMSRVPRVG